MPLMKTIALLAAVPVVLAQTIDPSPRDLLNLARPLTSTEIATVLTELRHALTAATFRLSSAPDSRGTEVLMGPDGRPKMIQRVYSLVGGSVYGGSTPGSVTEPAQSRWHEDFTSVIDYTGRAARRCDGSTTPGEMVIEYEHRRSTNAWIATARNRNEGDVGGPGIAPVFQMVLGAGPIASGDRRQIGGRWARALVSPWTPPPNQPFLETLTGDPLPNVAVDPAPNDATQSLWIDTESSLPLRWEVSERGRISHAFNFTYERIVLQPPAGVDAPGCIR
jgi:hypothetical protein